MINPFLELQNVIDVKKYLLETICSKKRADYLTSRYRKKTKRFCERHKGFFKCRQCKGAGLLKYPFITQGHVTISVEFHTCHACKLTGVETWLDKMIGGWKISV
jgi:hypothetical protein